MTGASRAHSSRTVARVALVAVVFATVALSAQPASLVTRPYLQLGQRFADGHLEVVWHTTPQSVGWRVDWRRTPEAPWEMPSAVGRRAGIDRDIWIAELPAGRTGEAFEYRVHQHARTVATGRGRAQVGAGRPLRFVVIGDTGDGTAEQRNLAQQMVARHRTQPLDFGLIAGDVAYDCGRREDYARKFFPVFNPASGDSLLSEVPFAVAAGNHDVGDLRWPLPPFRCSSDYSHFLFWRHPAGFVGPIPVGARHGPARPSGPLPGDATDVRAVLAAANYSFTWGDAHVTVLDSNRYVDWSAPALRRWLDADLTAAQAARWRFVLLHHPPFNLSRDHAGDQWTRYLAPIFEQHRVTAVFSGHVHNFQWLGPLRFAPDGTEAGRFAAGARGKLRGTLDFQTDYDGTTQTAARWPVYIVTGAGGGALVPEGRGCPPNLVAPDGCGSPAPVSARQSSMTTAAGVTLLERRITPAQPLPLGNDPVCCLVHVHETGLVWRQP